MISESSIFYGLRLKHAFYRILFFSSIFISHLNLFGQCLSGDALWDRISIIKDSGKLTVEARLQNLLSLKEEVEKCNLTADSAYAFLLKQIGIQYYYQADFIKACQNYQSSIKVIQSHRKSSAINFQHLISTYYLLSVANDSLGIRSQNVAALDSCILLATNAGTINIYSLGAIYKRSAYYYDVGDYHNCLFYASICQSWSKKFAEQAASNYGTGAKYESSAFSWQINSLLALKDFSHADSLLSVRLKENEENGSTFNLGTIYGELAEVKIQKGDFEGALGDLVKALHAEERSGSIINCKIILNNIGFYIYYGHHKDAVKALMFYRRALALKSKDAFQASFSSIEDLNIYDDMATAFVLAKQYDSAFYYFSKAFNQIKPGADEKSLLQIPLEQFAAQKRMSYLTTLMLDKADAYSRIFKEKDDRKSLNEALNIYKICDQLLDRIRFEQADVESKLFWRSDSRKLYERAIEACFNSDNAGDALYFFEKSRSILLIDQLNGQHWANEKQIFEQAQSTKRILHLERLLQNANIDANQVVDFKGQLLTERAHLNNLNRAIRLENPLYFSSYLDTSFISQDFIKNRILKEYDAFVELFSGADAVYILVIAKNGTSLSRISKTKFDSLSKSYLTYISNSSLLNAKMDEFKQVSFDLFQLLFKNSKIPSSGRVIFSPDGQYFPLEALITSRQGQSFTYFLNDFTPSYTYSARFLGSKMELPESVSNTSFLGIAPVEFANSPSLTALTGSERSLAKIQNYFSKGTSMTFTDASKSNFLDYFSSYSIIQLYTHAAVLGRNNEPVLYFADSALNLSDLNTDKKPATRLIVLAACETGVGTLNIGEGVFSFNRGFAALGVPSSITNLWSVDNASMYKLTELFYHHLNGGEPTDVALQLAKQDFLRTETGEKKLPYYWAASILVGSNQRFQPDQRSWLPIGAAISLGLLLFGLVAYKLFSKRQL